MPIATQKNTSRGKRVPLAQPLYVSTAVAGDIAQLLGAPHYSYHFAERLFRALLTQAGRPPHLLAMPECYATEASLPVPGPDPVHLIFRSTEQIRLLKPARNIACFPWEFPVLKTDTLPGEHPFLNQIRMLSLCDEIWTPSSYAARVLAAHGLDRIHHIPAPIPVAPARAERGLALAGLAHLPAAPLDANAAWSRKHGTAQIEPRIAPLGTWLARHKGAKIYLAILNPEDFRKNLDAMLRGFHHFRATHADAVLILKALTSGARFSLAEVAGDVIPYKLAEGTVLRDDGILVLNAYLTEQEMALLYAMADFYLCTSIAEGQNLPLLEAMAHGTAAITTTNTAMADYIDDTNAFPIAGRQVPNDNPHLAGTIAARPFEIAQSTARDVYTALCRAHTAPPAARASVTAAARATVTTLFAPAAIWPKVAARLAEPASARHAP